MEVIDDVVIDTEGRTITCKMRDGEVVVLDSMVEVAGYGGDPLVFSVMALAGGLLAANRRITTLERRLNETHPC